jgi:hypothetical protein
LSPPLPSVATALDSRCQVCNTLGAENSHAAVAGAGPGGRIEMNKKARCAAIMTVGDLSMLSHLPINGRSGSPCNRAIRRPRPGAVACSDSTDAFT